MYRTYTHSFNTTRRRTVILWSFKAIAAAHKVGFIPHYMLHMYVYVYKNVKKMITASGKENLLKLPR